MSKVKTNFGSIGGQRMITFSKLLNTGLVVPGTFRKPDISFEEVAMLAQEKILITPHEAFRRWKVARKAWRSRKWRNQLVLL